MNLTKFFIYIVALGLLSSCTSKPADDFEKSGQQAKIYPNYSDITIPQNIAPLNFQIEEEGNTYFVEIVGNNKGGISILNSTGIVKVGLKKWKKLLEGNTSLTYTIFVEKDGQWQRFNDFTNLISENKIDLFLYYRILYPGYESWTEISIVQRNLENFKEKAVVKNNVVEQNCVNCHAFNHQNQEDFMFHMRGNLGGTYFLKEGGLQKVNLKTKEMKNGAVYPRWHPSGNFVAFSSNKVVQRFHSLAEKKIEVSDLNSSLVLYDLTKNEMMQVSIDAEGKFMDTYPEWTPDGEYLYFCRAKQIGEEYNYQDIKYNLCRVKFNQSERTFGEPELVFDADSINKSVSFPRISPNGNFLVFTLHDYGCFPIWHKEADLFSIDLKTSKVMKCDVNSNFTESYHSWSSTGSWMVFSSKRGDGLTARPFISFVDEKGNASKPFVLPQEEPMFYKTFVKTFNVPEFANTNVHFKPKQLRNAAKEEAIQVKWSNN